MKIVTHNVKFHTDDVFAVAALLLVFPEAQVERTRDEEVINVADIVVDVGGVWDEERNRFDHHQIEGAGQRDNGIPYSSFGLVWKKFGESISGSELVSKRIDTILAQPIDAGDAGVETFSNVFPGVRPFIINGVITSFRPTWKEDEDWDKAFLEAVDWAKNFLLRQIKIQKDFLEAEDVVLKAYEASVDKRIIIIDDSRSFGREIVSEILSNFDEPIYAVFFRRDHKSWQLLALGRGINSFSMRRPLPEAWRAKSGSELHAETGVNGGIFCHKTGFMCVVQSRDAAIELAKIALNS